MTLAGTKFAVPTRDEWRAYARGELTSLDERPVVFNRLTQRVTQRALDERLDELDDVRMVLQYQEWGANPKWWPIFLYRPEAVVSLNEGHQSEHWAGEWIRGGFGQFHCIDCEGQFSGLVLDREAYALAEGLAMERRGRYVGCPHCGGNLKGLPLMRVLRVLDSD